MLKIHRIFAALSVLFLFNASVNAQVHISGNVTGTLAADTYIVDGPLTVPAGQSLTIEPGATLYFDGLYGLTVNGQLTAAGTALDSIRFLPNTGVTSWTGIDFDHNTMTEDVLAYALISGSNDNGIYAANADLTISHSLLTGNLGYLGGGIFAESNSSLTITDSRFIDNEADQHGGAILLEYASADIFDSVFENNRADADYRSKGGAISTQWATMNLVGSTFLLNHAGFGGGALGIRSGSEVTIYRNLFYQNAAEDKGGAIFVKNGIALIENNTIDDNLGPVSASAIFASRESTIDVVGNAITYHPGPSTIYIEASSDASFSYNDLYGNSGDNFLGAVPAWVGIISTVNANGDEADASFNIFEVPDYTDRTNRDYSLLAASALIDAGDPVSYHDPDGTIADIGAYPYTQGPIAMAVDLTPTATPVQIPVGGGSFTFDIAINNGVTETLLFDVWTEITMPNGTVMSPVILREGLAMPGNASLTRTDLPQFIDGSYPAGQYTFTTRVGSYPGYAWNSDSFTFEKLAGTDGGDFAGIEEGMSGILKFSLAGAFPNPFNPATTISFSLQNPATVHLAVFDMAGRKVSTLVDGWREAGSHQVTFDGNGLASGVYVYRLQAAEETAIGRMILTK